VTVEEKKITCIVCPIGCNIVVKTDGSTCEILEGEKCKRGVEYAQHEALDPRRMLTTSVRVDDGVWPLVSVKSSKPVPKDKVFAILEQIKQTTVKAPVKSGEVLIKDAVQTGIDIVATKTVDQLKT
jgi:CxxC motif-containing protein